MKQRTYTKKNRALIHAALVAAKPRLRTRQRDTRVTHICFAIAFPGEKRTAGQRMAQNMIMSRLRQWSSVGSWLVHKVPGFDEWVEHASERQYYDNLQAYRHRWLDALIEEFSK